MRPDPGGCIPEMTDFGRDRGPEESAVSPMRPAPIPARIIHGGRGEPLANRPGGDSS
jgi:hypothetical protein